MASSPNLETTSSAQAGTQCLGGLPVLAKELQLHVSQCRGNGVPTRCSEHLTQAGLCHQGGNGSLG